MASQIGQFLRQIRNARGLSLAQTALAAGIGRVTLIRWETGAQQPRLTELNALLTALEANEKQKRQALALLEAPRGQALVREEISRIAAQVGIGPMPHGGDLLRALRLRQKLSLDVVAERLGVTSRTLRRWEKAEVWPSTEQLHALCYLLEACEEEIITLTCGGSSLLPASNPASPQTLRERVENLWSHPIHPPNGN